MNLGLKLNYIRKRSAVKIIEKHAVNISVEVSNDLLQEAGTIHLAGQAQFPAPKRDITGEVDAGVPCLLNYKVILNIKVILNLYCPAAGQEV